jgi:hypothetical protein
VEGPGKAVIAVKPSSSSSVHTTGRVRARTELTVKVQKPRIFFERRNDFLRPQKHIIHHLFINLELQGMLRTGLPSETA